MGVKKKMRKCAAHHIPNFQIFLFLRHVCWRVLAFNLSVVKPTVRAACQRAFMAILTRPYLTFHAHNLDNTPVPG